MQKAPCRAGTVVDLPAVFLALGTIAVQAGKIILPFIILLNIAVERMLE